MLISVVIPTYNRAAVLARAIQSVYAQTWLEQGGNLELIVVDDGSDDGTAELVQEMFPQVRYIYQHNAGVSAARNVGLRHCQGDWIALLDSDDEWLPNKLQRQVDLLAQTGLLICHTEEIWIRNGRRVNQMNKHKKYGGWIYPYCLPLCAMSPSSIIIHRSVFEEIGNFDESFEVCEDYEMWLRLTSSYQVAFVQEACINKYGGHADQLSTRHWGMDRFRVRALEKILRSELAPLYRGKTLDSLLVRLEILLNGAIKHRNRSLEQACRDKIDYWQGRKAC